MNTAGIERMINVYGWGARICLVIAVVGAVIAVISFFRFNIRQIYRIRSGRAKRESVDEMNKRNRIAGIPYTDELDLSREKTAALDNVQAAGHQDDRSAALQQEMEAVGFVITESLITAQTEERIELSSGTVLTAKETEKTKPDEES